MYFNDIGFLTPYTEYSVVIPIVENKYFLFEIRSKFLKNQPSEVSFPGGKIEDNESPLDAGIRELYEEIGIKPKVILGKLKYLVTPFNIVIHPFIVKIEFNNILLNTNEVESIFKVPIDIFEKPLYKFEAEIKIIPPDNFPYHLIPNGKNYKWRKGKYEIMFFKYNDRIIWGLTARLAFEAYKKLKGGIRNDH
ncbi:MAG: hypothetical protein PWP54_739 [Thermosipho sp. (in: thermotogales)]|nr:hypothetical protein [Thermosipho sp. (in: thermotogales)]